MKEGGVLMDATAPGSRLPDRRDGQPQHRVVVSICGPSGAGKSTLTKTLVERLGHERSVRIPADHYLVPASADEPLGEYLRRPLRYDWALLATVLALPDGNTVPYPNFDFERTGFQRLPGRGRKTFTLRRIAILDAMYPYPQADLRVRLCAPDAIRRARVAARDERWGTRVVDSWAQLEVTRQELERLEEEAHAWPYDLILTGTADRAANVDAVVERLRACGWWA
jgi:uridine kinase